MLAALWLSAVLAGLGACAPPGPAAPYRATSTSATPGLEAARQALVGDNAQVVVLGDSISDEPDEWVHQWALALTRGRQVTFHQWGRQEAGEGYGRPDELSQTGVPLGMWNASVSGSRASYAMQRLASILPADPDLVLLAYGHNHDVASTLEIAELHEAVQESAPEAEIVVLLQNPQIGDANAPVREAIAAMGEQRGWSMIDVAAAFAQDGRPLQELLEDRVHLAAPGTQLWVETVQESLGG